MMTDLPGWKMRGPVLTLRKEHAEWDPSHDTWQAPRGVSTVTFRRDGQVGEGESHNPDGSVSRWARVYDDRGRLLEAQSWTDNGPSARTLYSYDTQGRLTEVVNVASDGTRQQAETCLYDSARRKTKLTFLTAYQPDRPIDGYGVEGSELAYGAPGAATLTIAYDDRELPAEASFHDANGGLIRRIVFSRDNEGRVLTEVAYFGGETPFPDALPPAGNIPLEEREKVASLLKAVFADQVFSSVAYAYDPKGRVLERTRRMGTLSEERTTFQYDEYDNPIAQIEERRSRGMGVDDDGVARASEEEPRAQHNRFDCHYDSHGNWTERIVLIRTGLQLEFQRSNIERRTITYYEL